MRMLIWRKQQAAFHRELARAAIRAETGENFPLAARRLIRSTRDRALVSSGSPLPCSAPRSRSARRRPRTISTPSCARSSPGATTTGRSCSSTSSTSASSSRCADRTASPIWGERREYTWYIRDGFFVRSPIKFNGVDHRRGRAAEVRGGVPEAGAGAGQARGARRQRALDGSGPASTTPARPTRRSVLTPSSPRTSAA